MKLTITEKKQIVKHLEKYLNKGLTTRNAKEAAYLHFRLNQDIKEDVKEETKIKLTEKINRLRAVQLEFTNLGPLEDKE